MCHHLLCTLTIIPWLMCYPQPSLIQRDIVGLQNLQLNFNIRYRPGKVNKDADILSRIPLDINQYMPTCTQATSQEVISATLSDKMALRNAEAVWITAVSGANETLKLVSDIIDPRNYHKIEPHVILASQKRDPSIGRVLECKVGGGKPAVREIGREIPYTTRLFEWPKLRLEGWCFEKVWRELTVSPTKAILPSDL